MHWQIVGAVLLLVGCSKKPEPVAETPDEVLDGPEWFAWQDFGVGSWITWSSEVDDRRIIQRTTLVERGPDRMVLNHEGPVDPVQEIRRPNARPEPPSGRSRRLSREKIRVAGEEKECVRIDYGQGDSRKTCWYSKDVPGWLVQSDLPSRSGRIVIICEDYQRR